MKKVRILLLGLLFISISLNAQVDYTTKSKSAIRHYENARNQFGLLDYDKAIDFLNSAIKSDKRFYEAHQFQGYIYFIVEQYENAIGSYKKAIEINPDFSPDVYYLLADAELKIGRYEDARINFTTFLEIYTFSEELREGAEWHLSACNFAINAINNPVPFNPKNLGGNINSEYDEYWPSLSADEEILVITVNLPIDTSNKNYIRNRQEDFYISNKTENGWEKVKPAGRPLNTPGNEGAQSITSDGHFMFFTACGRGDGKGMCDIYVSKKIENKWSYPQNLGSAVNTSYSEKQPSISPDGKTLYFASDRPGGKGKMDLWKSTITEEGQWGKPENMGDSINTPGIERSPFIHHDNQTFYYSTDGKPGMGGADLYMSKINQEGVWSASINLGYPINTQFDEVGLVVNAKGNRAYFSSDRLSEKGRDIYEFEMYSEIRPVEVSYMKGKIFNAETKKRLFARFELIDLGSTETTMEAYSDEETGEFLVCIPTGKDYALNVSKKGYLFFSENFALKDIYELAEPYLVDIPLQPVKSGERIILRNIFYETDSYELKKESMVELNKLLQFIIENPDLRLEISGHTDSDGPDDYNLSLSENRAKSVVNFLLENNVGKDHIVYKGYGETLPLESNDTEEGRSRNRRTEVKILGK